MATLSEWFAGHPIREYWRGAMTTALFRGRRSNLSRSRPWRDASNEERQEHENSLLLTTSMDHLFDRGLIGFDDNGQTIASPLAHQESLAHTGLDPKSPKTSIEFLADNASSSSFIEKKCC